ncbi:MAG: MFS transporter [Candidatus Marsarchaeota archaeon]|nr:MFS transporter [Candidatus Marsarchaeota archaeon]MCL5419162.1 MFS transporter [Candidatus Marsarchaeota archaeon]
MGSTIADLEEEKLSSHHIKIMLISGISFFTDAYDLFIIGVILILIKGVFATNPLTLGMLASSALFGAVIGPMVFGYFGDKFGRRRLYWITVSILAIAAVGSALSGSLIELILWRLLLGIAIGGDYPLSSTIVAEYSNKSNRGALVASTFAMQGFGIVAGILLALGLLYGGVSYGLAWRLLLAFGAVPALIAIPVRKKLNETPWYNELVKRRAAKKQASFYSIARKRPSVLVGTALSWFLVDVTYYGTGIFTPYIATLVGITGTLSSIETSALLLLAFAVPGYWVAVALIDRQGRRSMQIIGFFLVALCFLAIAAFGSQMLKAIPVMFFAIYGLSFFFTNYGPNTTTYVYPVELYPTEYRTRGHGFAATMGKLGATISALLFPIIILTLGKFTLLAILGGVALIGSIETLALLPETKRKSLEITSREFELHLVTDTLSNELSELSGHAESAAKISEQALSNVTIDAESLFEMIKNDEHNADMNVKNIFESITSLSINPSIYDDISHLAKRIDDIVDIEEAVASRILIYSIRKPDWYMHELAVLVSKCAEQVSAGLKALASVESSNSMSGIEEVHARASSLENDADLLLRKALEHASKMGAKKMIEYKEIYEWLELATDKSIDVLDIIEDIGLRYVYSRSA